MDRGFEVRDPPIRTSNREPLVPHMTLLILGASARAAAQSARRAGLSTLACDLFADRDLVAAGSALRIDPEGYPARFEELAAAASPGPWIYTGALENHPELLERIACTRPLWGIHGASLRNVRDPIALADAIGQAGLLAPAVREDPTDLPRDGSWLVKPRRSAGGRSIRPLLETSIPPGRPSIYQERIAGSSLAALFVGKPGGAALLGITRQLVGRKGEPFAYVGSLGPWPIPESTRSEIHAIGATLVKSFQLRGLFGVDLMVRADGRPVPVEVNPRYTASVEVLELASGRSLIAEHQSAFVADPAPGGPIAPPRPDVRRQGDPLRRASLHPARARCVATQELDLRHVRGADRRRRAGRRLGLRRGRSHPHGPGASTVDPGLRGGPARQARPVAGPTRRVGTRCRLVDGRANGYNATIP